MIAANYTAHLYCDCNECSAHKHLFQEEAEYIGNSWSKVVREARKDGWKISKCRTRCYAPGHKIKRVNGNN